MTPPDDSLTDPDWSDPDWSAPEERAAPRWARRDRPTPVEPERGRTAALVAAASVVVVVAVVAAVVSVPAATPAVPPTDAAVVAPVGAYSSSAFCPAGTGTAATTTIYLTNSTRRAVTGVMTAVGTPGSGGTVPATHEPVRVPPLGTLAVDPVAGLPAGSTAASFTFAGGGVVVTQAVSGPGGWSTAPCPSQISSQWGFAGGSTAAGNSLTLSLFDPAAVEAVVNVSFITEAGVITPQQYQGLVVPPGQLVDENVGDFVQGRNTIATLVDAQAGGVVASEFQQWSGSSTGVSLRAGSPSPSTTWRFAQTTALPQSTVDITLANPGQTAATATISLGLSSGSVVPHRLVVAPSSVAVFSASGTAGLPEQVPYALTITSSAPIVAGRSVEAPTGSVQPGWGSSSATATVATHWLVPGPGIPNAPGTADAAVDSLAVANPGPSPVRVVVGALGGSRPVAVFTVDPGRLSVLGSPQVEGLPVLIVSASGPVNVEEDSGPSGAPGVVSSTGFPLAG
jgi:hypothetical protein